MEKILLLQPEVYHILQVLKKSSGGRFFSDDSYIADLTASFTQLRLKLKTFVVDGIAPTLEESISPFILLFQTAESGAVVATGLSSVAKLIRQNFFDVFGDPDSFYAYRQIILAVSVRKFDIGEISGDEYSLQRLLDVLLLAIKSSSYSKRLGDADLCGIIDAFFSLTALNRPSDLFRRHVELSCIELCMILFGRLEEQSFISQPVPSATMIRIRFPGSHDDANDDPPPAALAALEAEFSKVEPEANTSQAEDKETGDPKDEVSAQATSESKPSKLVTVSRERISPYGVALIQQLMNFLTRLLDPSKQRGTDRLKSLSLVIINDLCERHHCLLQKKESFWVWLSNTATKFCIQLLLSDNPSLQVHLSQTLMSIFSRFGDRLIAQGEFLLTTLINIANQKPLSIGRQVALRISKEYYLELLSNIFLNKPSLARISVYYENGPLFGFPLKDLVDCLLQLAQPDAKTPPSTDSDMALELLIQIISLVTEVSASRRTAVVDEDFYQNNLDPATKLRKVHIRKSAELFNKNPKESFAHLAENQITSSPATFQEIAKYLRRTAGLDKRVVGEILSKPTNIDILREFLTDFHFSGLRIDEALRLVLESFRLPGESQQISRIMEIFAEIYFGAQEKYLDSQSIMGGINSPDPIFILAYSIVMLNTDQHSKHIKNRMTEEAFLKNNRGLNDGKDFDPGFLRDIYKSIKQKEIVMPEEHSGDLAFNYIWNEQLKKCPPDSQLQLTRIHHLTSMVGRDISSVLWRPCLSCFKHCKSFGSRVPWYLTLTFVVIIVPKSESTTRTSVRALSLLGKMADLYLDKDAMDELLAAISECMAIAQIVKDRTTPELLTRYVAKSDIFQSLMRTFFKIYRLYGNNIGEIGWQIFFAHVLYITEEGLLKIDQLQVLGESESTLTGTGPAFAGSVSRAKQAGGLLSTLSSYWTGSNNESEAPASSENIVQALEFLKKCDVEIIVLETRLLNDVAIKRLINGILENIKITKPPSWGIETLVFAVHLTVSISWINRDRMAVFWDSLFTKFSELSRDLSVPTVIKERAILGLGKLSLRFAERPEMQKEIVQFFQLLCYLPPEAFQHLAEPALEVVMRIVELDPPILHGSAIWPHYFTVLALSGRSKSCGPYSFSLLTNIVREDSILFPLEFYTEYVDLLNGFISTVLPSHTNSPSHSTTSSNSSSPKQQPEGPIALGRKALIKFANLERNVLHQSPPDLIADDSFWRDYIIPVHCAIAQQCYHPVREIGQFALYTLQKTLMSIDYQRYPYKSFLEEFELVLLPLLEELKKPEIRRLEEASFVLIDEVQVRASAMVGKVVLNNLNILFPSNDQFSKETMNLWCSILSSLLRFLEGPAVSDLLKESIPETIKNMLLVLAASDILKHPQPGEIPSILWTYTWRLLDPSLPRIRKEAFEVSEIPHPINPSRLMDQATTEPIQQSPAEDDNGHLVGLVICPTDEEEELEENVDEVLHLPEPHEQLDEGSHELGGLTPISDPLNEPGTQMAPEPLPVLEFFNEASDLPFEFSPMPLHMTGDGGIKDSQLPSLPSYDHADGVSSGPETATISHKTYDV